MNQPAPASAPLATAPPGAHGGDGAAVARAFGLDPAHVLDLSASLNPFAPDVAAAVAAHSDAVGRYPDAREPTAVLAAAMDVDPDLVVLTNGGAEAIALVAAQAGAGHIDGPEFSLYARHLTEVRHDAPRWRSNPNNPLGTLADPTDVAGVWDEAFYPLAAGEWTRGDVASWRLGSLTKLWSCPGLRLGYAIAPSARAAESLRRRQQRWAVNGLALAVLPELLAATDLAQQAAQLAMHRQRVAAAITTATGLVPRPGVAPWLLLDGPLTLREDMARRGVVVRDCDNFGLPGVFRIALPGSDDVGRVVAAIVAALAR